MGHANLSNGFASNGHLSTTSLQRFCGPWATRQAAFSNQVDSPNCETLIRTPCFLISAAVLEMRLVPR
jgi:hypothetical protein